jgi:hypothetical protein
MTLEEYYRTRYANPDVWGTEGAYYGGMFNRGGDGAEDIDPVGTIGVNLNGIDYTRTGTADNSRFDAFGGGYQYDPTYGWIVPSSTASAYGDSHDDSMNYFLAALGGVAAPYAASTGLMSFGGGLGGGENVLNGMDLSSGLTNLDDFSYGTLTSGLEGGGAGSYAVDPALGAQQAIDGSMQSIYDANAAAGMGGYNPSLASSAAGSLGSSGSGLFGGIGDFINSPLGSLIGKVAPSVLGYLGADKQADMNRDMFNQYWGAGAPFRSLALQTTQPGFDIGKEPGFQNAMDTTMNTYMRAASAGNAQGVAGGNPFNNPGAFMESQKYLAGNLALPYLQNYRSWLTNAGQLGMNQAVPFGTGQVGAEGGKYDSIGYGLGELFNTKPDYAQQYAGMFNQPKLTTSGGFV